MTHKATVLFVCIHNAGRSQMAAGYLQHLAGDRVQVLSAGTEPKDHVNPSAVQAMAEEGIDIATNTPKVLTTEAVQESDYVITMGCGDTCPFFPGKPTWTGRCRTPQAKASRMSARSATRFAPRSKRSSPKSTQSFRRAVTRGVVRHHSFESVRPPSLVQGEHQHVLTATGVDLRGKPCVRRET